MALGIARGLGALAAAAAGASGVCPAGATCVAWGGELGVGRGAPGGGAGIVRGELGVPLDEARTDAGGRSDRGRGMPEAGDPAGARNDDGGG
jgi:hypothetical protein